MCAARSRINDRRRPKDIDGATRAYPSTHAHFSTQRLNDVIVSYRNGGPLRIRDIARLVTGPEVRQAGGLANGKRGCFWWSSSSPANVIDTVDRQGDAAESGGSDPAAIKIEIISERTQTIPRSGRVLHFTCCLTHCARCHGPSRYSCAASGLLSSNRDRTAGALGPAP